MAGTELMTTEERASLSKALLVDRYPLPSALRPEGENPPHRQLTTVQDLLDNIRHGYPTPSEMRQREADRAAAEAEREEQGQ
jgi:hypothetical protein